MDEYDVGINVMPAVAGSSASERLAALRARVRDKEARSRVGS